MRLSNYCWPSIEDFLNFLILWNNFAIYIEDNDLSKSELN